jgi:hypothetical protein
MKTAHSIMAIILLTLSVAYGNIDFSGENPSLNGKIVNWPINKKGSVKVEVGYGKTTVSNGLVKINENGSFANLIFPGSKIVTPNLKLQGKLTCPEGYLIPSTSNLKTGLGILQIVDATNLNLGTLLELNFDPNKLIIKPFVGAKKVTRLFSNIKGLVKGNCTINGKLLSIDTPLNKGWNIIVLEVTSMNGKIVTSAKMVSGDLPNDVGLYYSTKLDPSENWLVK